MLSQKFTNNRDLIITVFIVAGIVIVLNFFAANIFWRVDLTQNKIYSSSAVTKDTMRQLKDIVTVKLYFSKDLPNEFIILKRQLMDILSDYKSYSGGKFQYQLVDPEKSNEASKVGIPKIQFNEVRQDKLEVGNGYMGLAVYYQDKQEIIPLIQQAGNFEYQLTSIIKKLTSETELNIGIVQSHGSLELATNLTVLSDELSKIYQLIPVDLKQKQIPDNIKTLIIVGPKENFADDELKLIDKYLISGRAMIVWLDGYNIITKPVNFAIENKTNLISHLAKYGITVEKNLIADVINGIALYNQGANEVYVNYPLWPKLIKDNFNAQNGLVSQLDSVILPWASSISLDKSKISDQATLVELAKSSRQSWAQTGNISLDASLKKFPNTETKAHIMAVELQGTIKSVMGQGETKAGRLMVIGNSSFVKDEFIKGAPNNIILAQNIIDGMTLDGDLSQIRSRNIVAKGIKNISDTEKANWRYLNVFGLTGLVFIYGLVRYYLRKKTKTIEL